MADLETAPVTTTSPDQEQQLSPKRWIALTVILVAAFMDMLDSTILNVTVPSIQRHLGSTYAQVQWITAGYQIAFALLLILGGRLGDIYGRKRIFQLGVLGFTLASILAAASQNSGTLIAARLVEGGFAAVMVPQVLAIIHVSFPPQERAKAFGMFGMVAGLAAISGLSLGGLLVQWNLFNLDWRLVFLINVPIGLFGLIVGQNSITESKAPNRMRLDLVGTVLATATLFLLMFPLIQGRQLNWPAWGWVLLALTPVGAAVFIYQQRARTARNASPLVVLSLFKLRSFTSALSVQLAFNIGVGIFFLSWTLYLQFGLGWTPMHAGLTSLPFCIATFITSAASYAVLAAKMGRKLLQLGAVLVILGIASYVWVINHYGAGINTWEMIVPLALFGLGFGMVMAPIPDIATSEAPRQDAGSASGLVNTNQQLGFAVGTALVSAIFFGALAGNAAHSAATRTPDLTRQLTSASVSAPAAQDVAAYYQQCTATQAKAEAWAVPQRQLCTPAPAALSQPQAAAAFDNTAKQGIAATFVKTFSTSLWWFVGITVLAFLLMLRLPRKNVAHEAAEGGGWG